MRRIGARVSIVFEHRDSGASYEFQGWVTDVRIDTRVHFIGEGDVVRLNGSRGMDSFVDSQLATIVSQSTQNVDVPVDCNPDFNGVIPYMMRYQESVFGFLNRLSSTYNEMFFYDGKTLHFGQPKNTSEVTLFYDHDVFCLTTHASAVPHHVAAYDYIHESDAEVYAEGADDHGCGLLSDVKERAERLFEDQEMMASPSPVTSDTDLKALVDQKSKTLNGAMLSIEGQTRTCRITLGGIVEVLFPDKLNVPSLGRYRVVELVHKVDKSGNYSNHFVATPENNEFITQRHLEKIKAYPEMAVVCDNNDPSGLGRVQVQFDWQKRAGKTTNWIRVQTPDAGGSGMANRGLVFIPEVGDQVMVGYEFGDPSRPYVMGSVFSGSNGKGGGNENNVKSILTKSGHQIVFNDDDDDWGISISDKNGNVIKLDTKSKNITLSAGETISLLANNISIDAAQMVSINAGENVVFNSSKEMNLYANENVGVVAGEEFSLTAKNISTSASEKSEHTSDTLSLTSNTETEINSQKIGIDSTKENLVLATGGDVDTQAKGKVNLF
ncbi:MAG: type IV secretion protein Rhs [Bacteroidales bacterium]|nr:type IV secretion protein Rhs [Candidatus Scybalocola fimicaballi]